MENKNQPSESNLAVIMQLCNLAVISCNFAKVERKGELGVFMFL